MNNDHELHIPEEGASTLIIQFTKRELDRLKLAITHLRQQGQSEDAIRAKMKQQLKSFDAHTLDRIYQRSLGGPIADDITAEQVVKEEAVKVNTIAVDVQAAFPHLGLHSLVQYRGEEWFVQRIDGLRYFLKKVL